MKIKIENYRGFEIFFKPEKETFYLCSDSWNDQNTKKSFAACKKYIDDFIKDNNDFKSVWVEKPQWGNPGTVKRKLIGIRKDNRFVYEDEQGEKCQISEYEEKDYILVNPENEIFYRQIEDCIKRKKMIEEEIKEINSNIIKKGLQEIKAKYSI